MYADALNVIQEAIFLSIAVLDTRSGHARELAPERGDGRPRQLFVSRPGAALVRVPVQRRPSCPSCAIGPSPFSDDEAGEWHVEGFDGAQWRFAAEGDPTPPVVAHVAIDQQLIMRGDPVEISWSARNATHVLIDGVGRQPAAGSAQIMLTRTNRLRIEAVNPFGQTTAHTPVVRVLPRPVLVAPRVPDVPRSMMPSSTLPPLTPPVFTLPEIPPLAPTETPVFLPPPMLNLHR
jgi:hypothetical protein